MTFTALQTGALDATEFVSPYNDLAAGYHTVAEYYYYPGWHEPGSTLETIFNKERFEALPEDLQAILLAGAESRIRPYSTNSWPRTTKP